jgi:segregation and condensation protein B
MSPQAHILKAKLEAVIYAAEEPVTLAQLIGLLGEEAQQDIDFQQPSLALEDEEPLDNPGAPGLDSKTWVEPATEPVPTNDADALNAEITGPAEDSEVALAGPAPDLSSRPESASSADAAERPAGSPAATESTSPSAEEKKAQREREAQEKLKAKRLRDYFRSLLDALIADYASPARGLEIREVAGGFRLATKPEFHDAVRGFVKSLKPPLKLSLQALETLAVVAYKQPVTAPEISEIRGVESAGTIGSLMTRKLVTTAGRKQVIGRPILYKTTKDFLVRFGLKDINELPSIEEFEKMAGELNDAVQEEIDMETPTPEEAADTPTEAAPTDSTPTTPPEGAPTLDEAHAVPEPTHIHHDTTEDLISDHSTHPEGAKHEPPTDATPE